ncbi:hypothetical protein, partial [Sodaliphilus sp.]|uniref:hypothetical protein n=1 Tax=Sodaliphilus sp. TaxID=2815818 RepID=UPI00389005F6
PGKPVSASSPGDLFQVAQLIVLHHGSPIIFAQKQENETHHKQHTSVLDQKIGPKFLKKSDKSDKPDKIDNNDNNDKTDNNDKIEKKR